MSTTRHVTLALVLGLLGCSGTTATPDAFTASDAATPDTSMAPDTGLDAATTLDAGTTIDASATPDGGPTNVAGTIVPLYTDPSDASWSQLVTAANAHPSVAIVAVINPNNGPTASTDPAYSAGIASLQAAHVTVVGYVATGYGTRAQTAVDADIDLYLAQYPSIDGIFFDEAAIYETGHEAVYMHESAHARAAGFGFLVANPGTSPIAAYADLFDVAMVYESDGAPAAASLAVFASSRTHCGIIPYAVATLDPAYVASIRDDVEYVYLTDDDLPNPWDTLPSYFDALLSALE